MENSAAPDQLASEANWSGPTLFERQDLSGFSRTRVKESLAAAYCIKGNKGPDVHMIWIYAVQICLNKLKFG